jgi:23S rRNA pseudouridine1911/1915/1917 synthase
MYKVLKDRPYIASGPEPVSYLEIYPKTGRTHQIRVHLKHLGHPVLSDPLYAKGRPGILGFARPALHALSLAIELPSGERRTFEAPLPADFVSALEHVTHA